MEAITVCFVGGSQHGKYATISERHHYYQVPVMTPKERRATWVFDDTEPRPVIGTFRTDIYRQVRICNGPRVLRIVALVHSSISDEAAFRAYMRLGMRPAGANMLKIEGERSRASYERGYLDGMASGLRLGLHIGRNPKTGSN